MENPSILSPSSSGRRSSTASNSPEFEFWMVRNPSGPETTLHSADQLFSGGLLLPLDLLNAQIPHDPPDKTPQDPAPGSDLATTLTASKRWKDIFRKNPENKEKEKKKKERKGGSAGSAAAGGGAELNINLWPFSRSRSAGTGGGRQRTVAGRKVSSAPCSRSNSGGESKSRKWPGSPSRGGVHLGRSSPVWQVKRVGSGRSLHDNLLRSSAEKGVLKKDVSEATGIKKSTVGDGGGAKAKVLNLNVPTCIGYRHHLSCKNNQIPANIAVPVAGGVAGVAPRSAGVVAGGEGPRGSNLFNLRNLFTKKSVLT